ncbi:ATP-binding protein [Streptomyces sparsogenes]|uniref:ATP-binding protein n=1 Tax=Streptomyces sparsogenes TaxID=67365 RepID=UPI0033F4FBBD
MGNSRPHRPHSYTLYCPPLETSPCIARDFVTSVLRRLQLNDAVDTAALCTAELAANAYAHAPGNGSVLWLAVESAEVFVTVYDGNLTEPLLRPPSLDAEGGRGLRIVEALADKWGTTPGAPLGIGGAEGKGVWFSLATGGA